METREVGKEKNQRGREINHLGVINSQGSKPDDSRDNSTQRKGEKSRKNKKFKLQQRLANWLQKT